MRRPQSPPDRGVPRRHPDRRRRRGRLADQRHPARGQPHDPRPAAASSAWCCSNAAAPGWCRPARRCRSMPRSSAPSSGSSASPRWRPSCARGAPASCASPPCRRWPTASCRASSASSCRSGRSSTSCCPAWCRMPCWRRWRQGNATWASPRPRWSMPPSSASACRPRPSSPCCPTATGWRARSGCGRRDFEGENFISLGPSTLSRFRIDRVFAEHGVTRILRIETPLSEIACALAGSGAGVVLCEPFTATEYATRGIVVRPLRAADRLRVRGPPRLPIAACRRWRASSSTASAPTSRRSCRARAARPWRA